MKYNKSTVDLLVTNKEFGPIIRKYMGGLGVGGKVIGVIGNSENTDKYNTKVLF